MSRTALITGATSGIGYEYSLLLAEKGWDLIITGRRREILEENAVFIREKYSCSVKVFVIDFNNDDSFKKLVDYLSNNRPVGFLVNSVGFSNHSDFFKSDFLENHKMIEAHISRMSELIHFTVDDMKKAKEGYIVNVSSLAGYLPSLSDPFYSGSKSFINTYSESIALILSRYNIVVQSLCPGFTRTDFHKDMNLSSDAFKNRGLKRWMNPKDVVSYSFKKLKRGKVIVIPGICNKIIYRIIGAIPKRLYYFLAGRKRALNEE